MSTRSVRKEVGRRTFLKQGAGAAAAMLVPGLLGCAVGKAERLDAQPEAGTDAPGEPAGPDTVADPRATVHVVLAEDLRDLFAMGREAASRLGVAAGTLSGATVFLKPNFVVLGLDVFGVQFDPSSGECTKPELVVGVAQACLEAGADRVTIGEGGQSLDAWDWSTVRFLEGNTFEGQADLAGAVGVLAARHGADRIVLSNLNTADDWVRIDSSSSSERVRDGLWVSRAFAEADVVISMPVLKSHQFSLMTASMKNFVGVAAMSHHGAGFHRCNLHVGYADQTCFDVAQAGICGAVMDICRSRYDQGRSDWAIVDCTIGLEGDGPQKLGMEAYTLGLKDRCAAGRYFLLAASDQVVADVAAARVMALDPSEVKHVQMARNLGFGVPEADIRFVGADLDALLVPDWKRPPNPLTDKFFGPLCG